MKFFKVGKVGRSSYKKIKNDTEMKREIKNPDGRQNVFAQGSDSLSFYQHVFLQDGGFGGSVSDS